MGDVRHKPSDADFSALRGSFGPQSSRGLDFYSYINHTWQEKAYIEPYESTFSVSDEIEDRVEKQLFANNLRFLIAPSTYTIRK